MLCATMFLFVFTGDVIQHAEEKTEIICSNLTKNTTEKIHLSKIFLTLPQYTIFHDESKKRMIFMAEFGTGKTSMMISKAKQLSQEIGQKVIFIIFQQSSLLVDKLRKSFGSQENCKVENFDETGNIISDTHSSKIL